MVSTAASDKSCPFFKKKLCNPQGCIKNKLYCVGYRRLKIIYNIIFWDLKFLVCGPLLIFFFFKKGIHHAIYTLAPGFYHIKPSRKVYVHLLQKILLFSNCACTEFYNSGLLIIGGIQMKSIVFSFFCLSCIVIDSLTVLWGFCHLLLLCHF